MKKTQYQRIFEIVSSIFAIVLLIFAISTIVSFLSQINASGQTIENYDFGCRFVKVNTEGTQG